MKELEKRGTPKKGERRLYFRTKKACRRERNSLEKCCC